MEKSHAEANEAANIGPVHPFDECENKSKLKGNLSQHKNTHMNLNYSCDQCKFKGRNEGSFKMHQLRHFSWKLSCDECVTIQQLQSILLINTTELGIGD